MSTLPPTLLRPTDRPVGTAAPAPEPLLPTASLVEQTMRRARHYLAVAMGGAAVLLFGMLIVNGWLARARAVALQHHVQAQQAASRVLLAEQSLTALAQLAVASGESGWVKAYDAQLPLLAEALTAARMLAPDDAGHRFDDEWQQVAGELDGMRQSAFEALAVGAHGSARAIFDSPRFRDASTRLERATSDFASATVDASEAQLRRVERYAAMTVALGLGLAATTGYGLWIQLTRRLARSRQAFLEAEERIQSLAASDLLTGLPNRTALHDAMTTALTRAGEQQHALAVLMIDLDRFKPVNDRHGHMVGDLVLKEVARRLRGCVRGRELQARYGGDEFVVVVEDKGDGQAAARAVAGRIVHALSRPMQLDSLHVEIGATVGIAIYPQDAQSDDELLRRADSALYRAKRAGRGGIAFYDERLDEPIAARSALEQAMREGIARGEFVPHYQPIVDLASGQVRSLELLCRWQHPQHGLLMPAEFIPMAEETGLIAPMTVAVLDRACRELQRVPAHWRLSVNVAPQQILDPALVPQLLQVLQAHDVAPSRLDVELTETALVRDTARARSVMQALKAAGMTVTLDDFGTGYSSLCYLAELSFDRIKIDRSFVRTLHERPESVKIVQAVIGLSRSLGVQSVAEGVETDRDAEVLRELGCGDAQGWFYGRPVPMDELIDEAGRSTALARGLDEPATAGPAPTAPTAPTVPAAPTLAAL